MDWKLFAMTFGAIFFAELADKTQLVGMSMAAKYGKPVLIWTASVSAYLVVTILSVSLGAFVGKHIKPEVMRYTAGIIFIILGALMLIKKI